MPRAASPLTRSVSRRTADAVQRRLAAGARRISVVLSPTAATRLAAIQARDGCTAVSAIERGLDMLARPVFTPLT